MVSAHFNIIPLSSGIHQNIPALPSPTFNNLWINQANFKDILFLKILFIYQVNASNFRCDMRLLNAFGGL